MDYGKKIRLGNFIVVKCKDKGVSYIKITDAQNLWSMRYYAGSEMFTHFDVHAEDKNNKPLEIVVTNAYYTSQLLEMKFQMNVTKCIGHFYYSVGAIDITKEEDDKIIEELRFMDEYITMCMKQDKEKEEQTDKTTEV